MGSSVSKKPSEQCVKIGVLGAANITDSALLSPASNCEDVRVVCVAARDPQKAKSFAKKHGIERVHQSYEDVLQDPEVDAVYIPLPNSLHYMWSVKAVEAGKHVLCEKPMVSNATEAVQLSSIIRQHEDTILFSVAYHWRCHPATHLALDLIRQHFQNSTVTKMTANMSIPGNFLPGGKDDIRLKSSLAGGALMDLSYVIDAVHFFMSPQEDKNREVVEDVLKANAVVSPNDPQIDLEMTASLKISEGREAHIIASFRPLLLPTLELEMEDSIGNRLSYFNFVRPDVYHSLTLSLVSGANRKERSYGRGGSTYLFQLRSFCDEISKRKGALRGVEIENKEEQKEEQSEGDNLQPRGLGTCAESLRNLKVIDKVYQTAGMLPRLQQQS